MQFKRCKHQRCSPRTCFCPGVCKVKRTYVWQQRSRNTTSIASCLAWSVLQPEGKWEFQSTSQSIQMSCCALKSKQLGIIRQAMTSINDIIW